MLNNCNINFLIYTFITSYIELIYRKISLFNEMIASNKHSKAELSKTQHKMLIHSFVKYYILSNIILLMMQHHVRISVITI